MGISFLPGEPNRTVNAVDTVDWDGTRLIAYCSGNNLIILENSTTLLQTVYLPSDGTAVSIEPETGAIAVSCGEQVDVLHPVVIYGHPTKWEERATHNEGSAVKSIAWSSPDELVVGSSFLTLWHIDADKVVWRKELANPVTQVTVSPDGCLIATQAEHDRLVKVWRRLSFDVDNSSFDFIYLPHPKPVLEVRWRKPFHKSQTIENTLYTFAEDKTLRTWSPYDGMDSANLQLWSSIDLAEHSNQSDNFFACVIDNGDLSRAIESSILRKDTSDVARLGRKQAELCMVFDSSNSALTLFSLENVGLKKQHKLVRIERILRTKAHLPYLKAEKLSFRVFTHSHQDQGDLSILIHDLSKGVLLHYTIELDKLLAAKDPASAWSLKSILTGHSKSVRSIMRAADGQSLLSQSRFDENHLWKPTKVGTGVTMQRVCVIYGKIQRAALVSGGRWLLTILENQTLVLWDCGGGLAEARAIGKVAVEANEMEPLCFFLLPELQGKNNVLHLVSLYDARRVKMWRVALPCGDAGAVITDLGLSPLPVEEELQTAVVVDPVGWEAKIEGDLSSFQRDVLTTISSRGVLRLWTAQLDENERLKWLETSMVETGCQDIVKAQVSSTKKVVTTVAGGRKLYIWDMLNRLLEYQEEFTEDCVQDIDWTTTPNQQNVLGVGFSKEVQLYCQLRFDYTNKTPSWAPFKKVDISRFTTHPIGDSIWLKNGTFVVGAGNQLFIQDEKVDVKDPTTNSILGSLNSAIIDKTNSIFDVCAVLNGPLPLYHPQLLIQSLFAGKVHVVKRVLVTLLNKIKFSPVLEVAGVVDINSTLGLRDAFEAKENGHVSTTDTPNGSTYEALFRRDAISESEFSHDTCEQLLEWLQQVSLPYMTRHQQITLASMIEAIDQTEVQRQSLDSNAAKYLLGFKLFKIHRGTQESMTMRDFNWALHSESQDILLELAEKATISSRYPVMLWPQMREIGVPYWLNNAKLVQQFEKLGRNYFSFDGKRDPVGCTLYYLALKKKQVLVGLWRTATWHKEQAKTVKLLSNNFAEPRWKSAAFKNAFALLGKHRFEYAAAFFLLGDSLKDAVNVIVRNMDDIALAIAVARVYEGDNGPVLRNLIDSHILPEAEASGDKWTTSWALWVTGRRDDAVKALAHLHRHKHSDQEAVKSFLVDDPVQVLLYRHLRDQSLKRTDSGGETHALDVDDEFQFVLKMCSIYARMGCDWLSLDLLRTWQFVREETPVPVEREEEHNEATPLPESPRLQRRPTLASIDSDTSAMYKATSALKPVSVQAFQEPDMSAFSFGF